MHDVILIEYLKGIDELLEDEQSPLFRNDSIFPEYSLERASIAVLVDEVEVVGGLEHVHIFDDMLVFFDIGEDVDLIDGALLELLVLLESADLYNFDRVLFVVVFVDGAEDLAVGALSDYLVEGVVLDDSDHTFNYLEIITILLSNYIE
jgi:hypothetical protein